MKFVIDKENRPKGFHLYGVLIFGIVLLISLFWSFDRIILLYCAFILTDLWHRIKKC